MGCTILLFLVVSFAFPQNLADSNLIQKTCKSSKYYGLCVSSLKSDPRSQNADTKGLAVIMVGIAMANATSTCSYLSSQLQGTTSDAIMKKVLGECADKYSHAADALQASLPYLASQSYDYASMHITAAADYPNACHNAFKRCPPLAYPPDLARREADLRHLCDVVLGIIANFDW